MVIEVLDQRLTLQFEGLANVFAVARVVFCGDIDLVVATFDSTPHLHIHYVSGAKPDNFKLLDLFELVFSTVVNHVPRVFVDI